MPRCVVSDSIDAIGSLFHLGGNLSQALDAALFSPMSVDIAVNSESGVIGGLLVTDVLAVVKVRQRV